MDPIPNNFPILSYVMTKLPTFKRGTSTAAAADDFDVENPQVPEPSAQEPHFEIAERMPHLKNQKLVAEMRQAVSDVAQTRSALQTLGTRPDHETVDTARMKLSEFDAHSSKTSEEIIEDYKVFKAVIALDEMHEAYEKMLSAAERRLEKIYEAAVAGEELNEEEGGESGRDLVEEEFNEEVIGILKDAESGKVIEKVDLSGRKLRIFPEAFGKLKTLVVLNMSNNQLEAIPDSIAGLENLEELNLSGNILVSLPDSIGLLFKLKILNVSGNKLTALPDSISHCRSLKALDASFNKLTYLPTNIGFELIYLECLSIHLNKIRSLPTSIGEMKSLRFLDAHFNELGGLPQSIGKLTNLEIMNLSSNFNDLTELPESISDLICLKELDVSNNQIHALPSTFGRLMNLTKLNVDQNPLVIPPKEVIEQGIVAVKAYMAKRWDDMVEEEQNMNNSSIVESPTLAGILTRSTSWLTGAVTSVGGAVSGYLGGSGSAKSNDDSYLNQQL